jgi:hypothetical protein
LGEARKPVPHSTGRAFCFPEIELDAARLVCGGALHRIGVSIFVQCSNDTVAIALHLLPSNFGRHNQGRSFCEKSPTRSRGLLR